jgi:hypothetical protein
MVQSLTVVGGNFTPPGTVVGLVTAPSTGISSSLNTSLQSLLTSISGAASLGIVNFENIDLATVSGNVTPTVGGFSTGLLDLSNTNPDGSTVAGTANASLTVPTGYNALFVQAPGTETISANASNFLAVFGDNSTVNFSANGSGTVVASSSGDDVGLLGSAWSFVGSSRGGDSVNLGASNSAVSVYGPLENVVGLGGTGETIQSYGSKDLIDVFTNSSGVVSMNGGGNVLVDGGASTVYATAGSTSVNAFFEHNGGDLYFINQSTVQATVSGAIQGAVGGNVTAFGGAGGGVYEGGLGGNNSLTGGTGLVTLYGVASGDTLTAAASSTVPGSQNVLSARLSGGNTTMIGASTSGANEFDGGTGTLVVSTQGSGNQNFFVGASGSENFTGSTVTGAHNTYYFLQDSTGSGSDVITNFNTSTDELSIDQIGGNLHQVSIAGIQQNFGSGGGSVVYLSNNTSIKLYGVTVAQADAATVGGGGYSLS